VSRASVTYPYPYPYPYAYPYPYPYPYLGNSRPAHAEVVEGLRG